MTVDYEYMVLRLVPSVCRQEFRNVGVVLHAPAAGFLGGLFIPSEQLECPPRVHRYLEVLDAVVRGDETGGPLAELPRSERFHWLAAPRSDVLQASPRHPGRAAESELPEVLRALFETLID